MVKNILDHYLEFSLFTNPGLYKEVLRKNLPDDIQDIGLLVRKSLMHRTTLEAGNVGSNADLRYGDITKVPWYRQCEDDDLPTVAAMLAELYRRDKKGFVVDRSPEAKLVLTCRNTAILMASILKSKRIPCRVRAGFAPYFNLFGGRSADHWINQYWNKQEKRWVTIDVDGSLHDYTKLNFYDLPEGTFDFAADAWINVREGKIDGKHFENAGGFDGLMPIARALFSDFHSLMNSEKIYLHHPEFIMWNKFPKLSEKDLQEIDQLAKLMQKPDENFAQLQHLWETNKKFRLLKEALL